MKSSRVNVIAAILLLMPLGLLSAETDNLQNLEKSFKTPPDSARPWVYWFWVNSNVTREGITADFEAMKRVGIGGVLLMDVNQGVPIGKIKYMDPQWQEMFAHSVKEAGRLGLQFNFNDGAGWCGSGGPWISPDMAIQRVCWSETHVDAGTNGVRWTGTLSLPNKGTEYKDLAVMAVREPAIDKKNRFKMTDFEIKTLTWDKVGPNRHLNRNPLDTAPAQQCISIKEIVDLTARMKPDGSLKWDVPAGEWMILRLGHAWSGATVRPVLEENTGPECDRLNKNAINLHFDSYVRRIMDVAGSDSKDTLVRTHLDSWEAGGQNWTAAMRGEFKQRRGYDPIPYLPILAGRILDDQQISERFLYDLRKTVSELMIENYTSEFQRLAHSVKLGTSIESYTTGGNDLDNADFADEPMAEFWIPTGMGTQWFSTAKSMSSSAHINGRIVTGAEAFTANNHEKWLWHPAMVKSLGDEILCSGVNRFVFHRYTAQPFGNNVKPGLQMGPWGLHYDRGNTWWEFTGPWHKYLARCQYMLRQGSFVADVLKLESEEPMDRFEPVTLTGYSYDACGQSAFKRAKVRDGKVVFASGASYHLVVLPDSAYMSVERLSLIRDMVKAGAVIVGEPPKQTPGLKDYQKADAELKKLVLQIWGDDESVTDRRLGKGRVFSKIKPEEALSRLGIICSFASDQPIRWIQRTLGQEDIYFVASTVNYPVRANCTFGVNGKQPQMWNPETGETESIAVYTAEGKTTQIPLHFEPASSMFIVFSKKAHAEHVISVACNGKTVIPGPDFRQTIEIQSATYGVPGNAQKSRDVTDKIKTLIESGILKFPVVEMAKDGDPAFGTIKTLIVECTINGKSQTFSACDTEQMIIFNPQNHVASDVFVRSKDGIKFLLETSTAGKYEIDLASGKKLSAYIETAQQSYPLTGAWDVYFDNGRGTSKAVKLEKLISWSEHPDQDVKFFSGTAAYKKQFTVLDEQLSSDQCLWLDLGQVEVMAQVYLNGSDLGIVWRPPYCIDISQAVKKGENNLEIKVVNLMVNRLIGDEQLPEDCVRNPNGSLKEWPQWLMEGKPSPAGRTTFSSWQLWKKDDPLQPSGLLGPVMLRSKAAVILPDVSAK